jgi:hypothetical protein
MKIIRYPSRRSCTARQALFGFFGVCSYIAAVSFLWIDGLGLPRTTIVTAFSISALYCSVMWKPLSACYKAERKASAASEAWNTAVGPVRELEWKFIERSAELAKCTDPEARQALTGELQDVRLALIRGMQQLVPKAAETEQAVAAASHLWDGLPDSRAIAWIRRRFVERLTDGLTELAVAVAGQRGARLRDTWMAHLCGAPEEGLVLSRGQRVRYAAGFVIAALRMRCRAFTDPLWRPVDWFLASESRTRALTSLVVGAQVIYIQKHDGLYGLLTEGWGWCAGCAVALHFFFRWMRGVRGVEPAVSGQGADEE